MRETFLLWDEGGNPICNAVVWQCKRSAPICERLKGTSVEAEVRARTGLIIDPYFSGAKLTWLMENNTSIRDGVKSGQLYFAAVDARILFKLTKGGSYRTDYTNASRTLLFNIHSLGWDDTLIEAFGAEGLLLPEVLSSSHAFGESDFGLFPKPIPIAGMIGDSHAAAFGEGCFHPGEAKGALWAPGLPFFAISAPDHPPPPMAWSPPSAGPPRAASITPSRASSSRAEQP